MMSTGPGTGGVKNCVHLADVRANMTDVVSGDCLFYGWSDLLNELVRNGGAILEITKTWAIRRREQAMLETERTC